MLNKEKLVPGLIGIAALVIAFGAVVPAAAKDHKKKAKASAEEPMVLESAKPGEKKGLPTVAEKTTGMEVREGFVTVYLDEDGNTVWLELPPPGENGNVLEMIHVGSLRQGLGSNPIGLDRGQLGRTRLLQVRRLGKRVLFVQPNFRFRALSDDEAERRATRDSFASSVLWGADIEALDDDGRALVNLQSFLVADHHGVRRTLQGAGEGDFRLDPMRSAVEVHTTLAFPDNVELEAFLTFGGERPGPHLRATAPSADTVSLVHHHSFIRLPEGGYKPRRGDVRIATITRDFLDYAVPLDESMRRQWVVRHRLEKTDPNAARSKVKEPIVYYVDNGAPEPIRSALVEGAAWWAEAFEAAGFIDAYRVEILPEDAHPLDVRYNVIQWVHRSTRGWSYGNSVVDPRTGEILKGHVSLGSLRVRQDRLLFEGLAGTAKTGTGSADDPVQIALARIRQLSAHEVGHTIGFAHNMAASSYDGRASVMDYPAPLIRANEAGELDFSEAYGVGIGSWDIACVQYAYTEFAPGADESAELDRMIQGFLDRGLIFVADEDSRPPGTSDPRGALWDNGEEPVAALQNALQVRRIALERFGEENIALGRPLAELEEVLAPLYFHHRYQLDAAVKVIGGMEYEYAVRGDGQTPTRILEGERQRQALDVVLSILSPEELDIPETVLAVIPPRAFSVPHNRELFAKSTWPAFDALGAAAIAADDVVEAVLHPARLGRLEDFRRRNPDLPAVGEVLEALMSRAFEVGAPGEPERAAALRRVVQRVTVDRLIATARHPELRPTLRAEIEWMLGALRDRLVAQEKPSENPETSAHLDLLAADVSRFLNRRDAAPGVFMPPPDPPPGSPIGMPSLAGCSHGPF